MAGAVLVLLAAFSPWALLRLIPLAELASGAVGTFRSEVGRANPVAAAARAADEWSSIATAAMRRDAQAAGPDPGPPAPLVPASPGVTVRVRTAAGGGAGVRTAAVADAGPDGGGDSAGDDPLPDPVFDWARIPTLELGPNGTGGSTGVWPHEDAS